MLDQIIKSVPQNTIDSLVNSGIPSDKTSDVLKMAQSAIQDQFKSKADSGDMSDLLNLFNGNQTIGSSSLVDGMVGSFAESIAGKLGISPDVARSAAASLMPVVLSKLNESTPDSGLSADHISRILNNSGSEGLGGLADKLKGFFS